MSDNTKGIWATFGQNALSSVFGGNQDLTVLPAESLKPNVPPVDYTAVYIVGGVLALLVVGGTVIYISDGSRKK